MQHTLFIVHKQNPVFEEAEPEFYTMAFFKTTIRVRNALQVSPAVLMLRCL